ncbi:hypothetical protein WAI91_21095, partial [Acinetobacter baumannii]
VQNMKKTISVLLTLLLLTGTFPFVFQTPSVSAQTQEKITNKDVIELVKTGISAEIITAKIKASKTEFDTSPAALQELKKEGVPDAIVLVML